MKRFLLCAALTAALAFFVVPAATAEDDDTWDPPADGLFHAEGTANGYDRINLAPETTYAFAFDVFNDDGDAEAIKKVAIVLPTKAYTFLSMDEYMAGLHDGFNWHGVYDAGEAMLQWMAVGPTSSVESGDIREGDVLTFSFVAITDADASDGFEWLLIGDRSSFELGTWFFGESTDDDTAADDDASDDDAGDDDAADDDDDDDFDDDDDIVDDDDEWGQDGDDDWADDDGDDDDSDDDDGACGC